MSPLIASLPLLAAAFAQASPFLQERDAEYCTFWSDDTCHTRSGSVDYDDNNNNIFQNGGPYFTCKAVDEFRLLSYPAGDSSGSSPNNCHVFPGESTESCQDLRDLGFTPGDGGYYRLSKDHECPAGVPSSHEKRDIHAAVANATTILRRDHNYLSFYVDVGCEDHSGSTNYASGNNGCFQNAAAYAAFNGDDSDWHLEQYGDSDTCGGSITACTDASTFEDADSVHGNFCHKLNDSGFNSGYGSYKIGRGGCP